MFDIWFRFCEVLVVGLLGYSFVGWMIGIAILVDYYTRTLYMFIGFKYKVYFAFGLFSVIVTAVPMIWLFIMGAKAVIWYILFGIPI